MSKGRGLYDAGVDIGVVSGIVGIASYRLVFTGRANHAGTTPMTARKDAGLGAAAFILAARQLVMESFPGCVANVGASAIGTRARSTSSRAGQSWRWNAGLSILPSLSACKPACWTAPGGKQRHMDLGLDVTALGLHAPAPMSQLVQQAIETAAAELGLVHPNACPPAPVTMLKTWRHYVPPA